MWLQYCSMLHMLVEWFKNHPLLYPFILFLLAAFISVYTSDIKQFLHNWPRTKERARRAREHDLTERLVLLKTLHNDSYQLVIYLTSRLIHLAFSYLNAVILLIVVAIVSRTHIDAAMVEGVVTGLVMGECYWVRGVLKELSNYDETVATFQERLAGLTLSGESNPNRTA
jgi:hypothetical protein